MYADENELDIPNGESNVENEDEDQNDEEQEYYVEGWYSFNSNILLCMVYFVIRK